MRLLFYIPFLLPLVSTAQSYSAKKVNVESLEVIRLEDSLRHMEVLIAPSIGNIAYALNVNGKNLFWLPCGNLPECKEKQVIGGNVFMAPWSNRLDTDAAYWANGKHYVLNRELGNIRWDRDKKPIHGLLLFSPYWEVVRLESNKQQAEVTSRLDFWKYPDLMAQFPFAHTFEMTYRLADGRLEVITRIENQSAEAMPVAIGYHPFFQLHDAARGEWQIHIPVKNQAELKSYPPPNSVSIADADHFAGTGYVENLIRDGSGRAIFTVQGTSEKLNVIFGPKYTAAVIHSPANAAYVSFEPLAAVNNALNLAHSGEYKDLQTLPTGQSWQESFWIEPIDF